MSMDWLAVGMRSTDMTSPISLYIFEDKIGNIE